MVSLCCDHAPSDWHLHQAGLYSMAFSAASADPTDRMVLSDHASLTCLLSCNASGGELSQLCRYYGVNDPVARKMLDRVDTLPKLVPPEDAAITTLYIGGLTPVISEDDIRDQFYGYGELQSVKKVQFAVVPRLWTYILHLHA